MTSTTLPGFVILGAQRGGTTSLYRYLASHPQVRHAKRKEVHYFDTHYGHGLDWYTEHFAADLAPGEITGEASPYYLYHPAVPARLRAAVPDAKLIAMLRNPVDRAYSHYLGKHRRRYDALSFEDALDAEEERLAGEEERLLTDDAAVSHNHQQFSYASRGDYAEQLERWFAAFPREQVLVLESEAFFRRTPEVLAEVQAFLGLPHAELDTGEVHHKRRYEPMRPETRARLEARFAEPNERLAALLGTRFSWNPAPGEEA